MSTEYKHGNEVPLRILISRGREIVNSIAKKNWSDLSMRIPAERDRDADLVISEILNRLEAAERNFELMLHFELMLRDIDMLRTKSQEYTKHD